MRDFVAVYGPPPIQVEPNFIMPSPLDNGYTPFAAPENVDVVEGLESFIKKLECRHSYLMKKIEELHALESEMKLIEAMLNAYLSAKERSHKCLDELHTPDHDQPPYGLGPA